MGDLRVMERVRRLSALVPRPWLEMIRFGTVGVLNAGIDTGVFAVVHFQLGASLPLANLAGFLVAVVNSYFINGAWTFRAGGKGESFTPSWRQGFWFILSNAGGAIVGTLVLVAASTVMPVLAAKALGILAGFVLNFSISRRLFAQGEA